MSEFPFLDPEHKAFETQSLDSPIAHILGLIKEITCIKTEVE
jgi:hypothetical protein